MVSQFRKRSSVMNRRMDIRIVKALMIDGRLRTVLIDFAASHLLRVNQRPLQFVHIGTEYCLNRSP